MSQDMKTKLFVITASLLLPFFSYAQCKDYFEKWATELHSKGNVDLAYAACKIWPMNSAYTVAALPISHKKNTINEGQYDLEILVADTLTDSGYSNRFADVSQIQYDKEGI